MGLDAYKITDGAIASNGVVSAPDKLTGTAAQNKAVFDKLIRDAVKGLYNGLIDALSGAGGAAEIGVDVEGLTASTVNAALAELLAEVGTKAASSDVTTALAAKADTTSLTAHTGNTSNPHSVTKAQVGLGNCNNTSDLNKPISTATQTALNGKQAKLTFDTTPTAGSTNPVTSGGVKTALDAHYVTAGKKSGTTIGYKATAEGNNTTASGNMAHAEGSDTTASGSASHAEGSNNAASGGFSHAEGYYTTASGICSHAEGSRTTASGDDSHAQGSYSTASGDDSHAEGDHTTASGNDSHAEGSYTAASEQGSHAEGGYTTASGKFAHAEGWKTKATHRAQHVFGECNILDASSAAATLRGSYVEIVGNGTANDARSNARTLDWSGNETLAGKLTLGAAPTADMDATTKKYVDDAIAAALGGN